MKKIAFLIFISFSIWAQKPNLLPRSTPGAEGVQADSIISFMNAANKSGIEFHSFMLLRHGKVVAETWWDPYKADIKHTMYSCSKSFTATAIGFAVSEGKLKVSDKVISFFPESLPLIISPFLAELEIRDLLTMSVGHEKEPSYIAASNDWVKAFLAVPIKYEPGSKFLYNSPATYMLSAIIQKVTGQKVIDYLQPRLFGPLGIENIDWETDPQGINVGGWGLRLKTEDMAKFGQLFLQRGMWKGKQILPVAWVEEAGSMKIMQKPEATKSQMETNEWVQGYAYQMWRCRFNAYRADGANGQYIIMLPEKDAVVVITAESANMQAEIDLVWKHILPALGTTKIKESKNLLAGLNTKLNNQALKPNLSKANIDFEKSISNKSFQIINDKTKKDVRFSFIDNSLQFQLNTDSVIHNLVFGNENWVAGTTSKFGPYLAGKSKNNRVGISPFKVFGSYAWKDAKTLEMTLRYIESPHTETILCVFDEDKVSIDFQDIYNNNIKRLIASGLLVKATIDAPKLIIRGDDMGYSHAGNVALIKSFKEGIETSIEVIVPSPWFPEAVKMLADNPKVDVGLHFAITSEWDNIKWRPLTAAKSLRNADGYFYPMLFHNNLYDGQAVTDNKWDIADIETELRAQIQMALKYIPRLSHVSGHMGSLAFDPAVKSMVKKVGLEYGLKMVDADSKEDFGINYIGFDFNKKTTEERIDGFVKMLDKLETGKTYVFVEHPGLDNEELQAIYHIGYEDVAKGRQDVTTIFTSEKVKEAIVRKGVKLVSYKDVLGK
jgi:CubicO group peptidase (beta-lactamase class C family)/predicted glycoside hydrolase/deacetylase ChbG (UPF0249 family)